MSQFEESSQTLTLSQAITKSANDILFQTLLNNPEKRAQVLELLKQEGIVHKENSSPNSKKYDSPITRLQKNGALNHTPKSKASKVRLESPSALGRRRALKRLESDSSLEDAQQQISSPAFVGTPKPLERVLEGVVAYCEIRSSGNDRSSAVKSMVKTMGAIVKENLCRGVTHVILKEGLYSTFRKAKLLKIHVVSVLWLEAVRKHKFKVPEAKYPAICADAYDSDISKICQEIQKDYDDVIQEELNNSTQFASRRRSDTPLKYITQRKKIAKTRSTMYESTSSGRKEAHNRTEMASPYKYACKSPDLSESESYISVGSCSSKSNEIVPCSQDDPTSLSLNHSKLSKVAEEDPDNAVPESNIAEYVKDSFELEKASKIRSPDSLEHLCRQEVVNNKNKENSRENEDSLRLHISTTDESNSNNTGNKSKSNNSSKNILGDVTAVTNKQSSSSNRKLSAEAEEPWNLNLSESTNSSTSKNKQKSNSNDVHLLISDGEDYISKSRTDSTISTISSDVNITKNKTKRRSSVGIKRPTKKIVQSDDSNNSTPRKKPVTDAIEASLSSLDTNITKRKSSKNILAKFAQVIDDITEEPEEIPEVRKKNFEDDTNHSITLRKSRRKTIANVSTTKFIDNNENIVEENKKLIEGIKRNMKNNSIEDDNPSESTRKSKRKTLAASEIKSMEITDVSTKDNENDIDGTQSISTRKSSRKTIANIKNNKINEDINNENEVETVTQKLTECQNKPLTSDSSGDKTKRRVRKLFNPNELISISHINWDEEPELEQKSTNISPSKKGNFNIPIKGLPKILSAKAQIKTKSHIRSTAKSAKTTKNVNQDNKNKRKSVRALNFNSTDSETSETEINKPPNPVVQTPSRRSERLARTPAKNLKIIGSSTDSEIENHTKSSDTGKTKYSSQEFESDSSEMSEIKLLKTTRKKVNTPNMRSQFLRNKLAKGSNSDDQATKTDEESKRRSTLDFVPKHSKKSLEQMRLSQKPKCIRLAAIVCTKFHNSEVQIFQQIVKKLGGFVVENEVSKRTTHLVAGESARTVNMLRAIVRGCWVLRREWIYKSLEAGKWLEEEDFEMVEFSPTVQKCRLERQSFGRLYAMDIFKSSGTVFISRASIPRFSDLEELVELCEGRVVRCAKDAQIVVAEYVSGEDVICVNEKWILDSITQNKMKKHKGYLLQRPTTN